MRASFLCKQPYRQGCQAPCHGLGHQSLEITNSRSFDHDSWRTGSKLRLFVNTTLAKLLRLRLFAIAPNAFRYLNRGSKPTNIIAGASALKLRRPKTTQTLAFPRRRGLLSRLIQKPTAAQAHPRGRGLSTHAERSDGIPANLGGSCVYRQANSTS